MNKVQQAIQSFRDFFNPTISPLPENNLPLLKNQAMGVVRDITGGLNSATQLSPPGQLARRVGITAQYANQPKPMFVPDEENKAFQQSDINDLLPALRFAGYSSLPALVGGAVSGGVATTTNELLKDRKINVQDAIKILAGTIGGARMGAQFAPIGAFIPTAGKTPPVKDKVIKTPDNVAGRTIRMIDKGNGKFKIDQRYGKRLSSIQNH